tara:strand:+ start:94 stop:891 length:798 start_codon:yes stop_codon:yes gene_type:complete
MPVQAEVRYLNEEWRHREDRPLIYSRESRHANTRKHTVAIHDARSAVADGTITMRRNGFTLARHPVTVADYADNAQVEAAYAREIVPVLKETTGASRVFVMSHQIRNENPETFLGAYSRYLHCDYALHPTPERERNVLARYDSDLAGRVGEFDYAWYNVWEPIERAAVQNQLCVLDGSTATRDDFREYHFTDSRDGGYATMPVPSETHRFWYFPNMEPGEALVFKQYDSRQDHPLVVPHTSFFDTSVTEDPGRRSVEYRALCVFE